MISPRCLKSKQATVSTAYEQAAKGNHNPWPDPSRRAIVICICDFQRSWTLTVVIVAFRFIVCTVRILIVFHKQVSLRTAAIRRVLIPTGRISIVVPIIVIITMLLRVVIIRIASVSSWTTAIDYIHRCNGDVGTRIKCLLNLLKTSNSVTIASNGFFQKNLVLIRIISVILDGSIHKIVGTCTSQCGVRIHRRAIPCGIGGD